VADQRRQRGLLDTSVIIDLEQLNAADLPREVASAPPRWLNWRLALMQRRILKKAHDDKTVCNEPRRRSIHCRLTIM